MSLKSFVNSRNGRRGILVTLLGLVAVGISGGILWYLFYLPTLGLGVVDQQTVEQGESNFTSVKVVEEEDPLIGLPSSTLEIHDSADEAIPETGFEFAKEAISRSNRESLVNTHLYRDEKDGASMAYDFKFYSSKLNDYSDEGDFQDAVKQFDNLANFGTKDLTYSSKPVSSGGRELTIDLTASVSFSQNTEAIFQRSWTDLISALGKTADFASGTRVDLTLRDSTGALTLKTVLNGPESLAASNLEEGLWRTFSVYLNSTYYSFLDTRKLSYSIERTSQDSVLTITAGDKMIPGDQLAANLQKATRDSDKQALFPGSFITYVVQEGAAEPVAFFPSSSRNW